MKDSIQKMLPSTDLLGARSGYSQDLIPILLAGLAVAVIVVIWALVFRSRPRNRHAFQTGLPSPTRKRRSKRTERRNPTLAETGGLPPARHDQGFGA